MASLIGELLDGGFPQGDPLTVVGRGLGAYAMEPWLDGGRLAWRAAAATSGDLHALRPAAAPVSGNRALRLPARTLGLAASRALAVGRAHSVRHAAALGFHTRE